MKFNKSLSMVIVLALIVGYIPWVGYASTEPDPVIIVAEENLSAFNGGDGTENNPYIVTTANQLNDIRNYPDKYFVQLGDISLKDMDFDPIGSINNSFSGKYDGANYIISGASIIENEDGYAGLFGYNTGIISNVNVYDFNITATSSSGIVYSGGIVGYNIGTITNCKSGATVYSKTIGEKLDAYAGGIVGYSNNEIIKCAFFGEVKATVEYIDSNAYAGGISGYGTTYTDCDNTGTISAIGSAGSNAYAGGIAAVSGSASNCSNSGNISASNSKYSYAGGIIGKNNNIIIGCNNSGSVYASTKYSYAETYSGGIVGQNSGSVLNCYNIGYISGESSSSHVRVGGIVGYNNRIIEDCYNNGRIYSNSSAYESHAGGIAGTTYVNSYIRRSYNDGPVISGENGLYSLGSAGGIVGLLQYGNIIQCGNTGSITAISSNYTTFAAGIAGCAGEGLIIDCFNAGNIHTSMSTSESFITGEAAGIFVGHNNTVSKCYNVGLISSNKLLIGIGGIHRTNGPESNSIESCYFINTDSDTLGISMTNDQAVLAETYVGFNFDDIWNISLNESYKYPTIKTFNREYDFKVIVTPDAPTLNSALAGNTTANVSFTAPANNGGNPIIGYSILVYSGGILKENLTKTGTLSPINVTGLTNGIAYTFKVIATNEIGNSEESNESDSVTPMTIPGAPTLTSTVGGNSTANVSFTAPVNNGGSPIIRYSVLVYSGGILKENLSKTGTSSPINVTGLTNGITYTFKVIAANEIGDSEESNESSAVTPTVPPFSGGGVPPSAGGGAPILPPIIIPTLPTPILEPMITNDTAHYNFISSNEIIISNKTIEEFDSSVKFIQITNNDVNYRVPISEITEESLMSKVNLNSENVKSIEIMIKITEPESNQLLAIKKNLAISNVDMLSTPIDFNLQANITLKDGTVVVVNVDEFETYVAREFKIPNYVNTEKVITGVRFNSNGSYSHVPSYIYVKDGIWYARISSLTNSIYSVISCETTVNAVKGHWAEDVINNFASKNIIKNIENFKPDNAVTRGEFAVYFVKALGLMPEGFVTSSFQDVLGRSEISTAIETARKWGLLSGYSDGTFKAGKTISRQEMAAIIFKANKILEIKASSIKVPLKKDINTVATWARDALYFTINAEIYNGYTDGTVAPLESISHAEVLSVIKNSLLSAKLIN